MKRVFRLIIVTMSEENPAEPVEILAGDELVIATTGRVAVAKWLQDHPNIDPETVQFSVTEIVLGSI